MIGPVLPDREGLTGTSRGDLYEPPRAPEDVTVAPDHRPMADQPRWRRELAIDWPEDNFVARRDVAKFLVLTSGAFVAGQAWIAAHSLVRARRPRPARHRIAALHAVPPGSVMMFAYPDAHDPCLLIRMHDGTLVADASDDLRLVFAREVLPAELRHRSVRSRDRDDSSTGHPWQLKCGELENCVRSSRRGPDEVVSQQILVDERAHRSGVTHRRNTADGKAGPFSGEIGRRLFDAFPHRLKKRSLLSADCRDRHSCGIDEAHRVTSDFCKRG